jgi:tRNA 2-thiouridine synthesizing protein A
MYELNLNGLMCPLPVLKTKKFLAQINPGEKIKVYTTDPASGQDLQDFCTKTGNKLVEQSQSNAQIITIIQRR